MPAKSPVLSEKMAGIVREMLDEGGGRPRDAALRLKKTDPKLFNLSRDESTLDHWTRVAATMFKRLAPVGQAMDQFAIPGLEMHRLPEMPTAISIPSADGTPVFRTLVKATVGELKVCIIGREKQLGQDATVLSGLRTMLEHRVEQGAEDDDPVFERVAAAEANPGAEQAIPTNRAPHHDHRPAHTRHLPLNLAQA